MTRQHPHPCDGLSRAAHRAFDVLAAGGTPRASRPTMDMLVDHGLVERHVRPIHFDDGLPPCMSAVYSVPVHAHIAWCEHYASPRKAAPRRASMRRKNDGQLELF